MSKNLSSENHMNGIHEFCEHSGYILSNCLARKRRGNLFAAISLQSTASFDQSSLVTYSQTTETSFCLSKLFDKLCRS